MKNEKKVPNFKVGNLFSLIKLYYYGNKYILILFSVF